MIFLAGNHKTTENLRRNPDFTISMATKDQLEACDYLGIETGSKVANRFGCAMTSYEKNVSFICGNKKCSPFLLSLLRYE